MSLPGYGSLEVSCKVGKPFVEVHIHELIGFISCLLQLMYQVTKLHKGLAEKVLFCTVLYCTFLVYFVSAMLLLSAFCFVVVVVVVHVCMESSECSFSVHNKPAR